MPKLVLIENNASELIKKAVQPKGLKLQKKIDCELAIEIDSKLHKEIGKDPLLHEKLQGVASEEYKSLLKKLVGILKEADKAYCIASNERQADIVKGLEKDYTNQLQEFKKNGEASVNSTWKDLVKNRQDLKEYKFKAVCSTLMSTGGLIFSALSIAAAPAVSPFAIVKLIREAAALAQKAQKAAQTAETAQRKIDTALKQLESSYKANKKAIVSAGGKDTAKVYLNALLGTNAYNTVTSTEANIKEHRVKILFLDDNSHKLARTLKKALDTAETVQKDKAVKSSEKVLKAVEKMENAINAKLVKIEELQRRIKAGDKYNEEAKKRIDELLKNQPNKWKLIQKGTVVVELALAPDDYSDLGQVLEDVADEAKNILLKEGIKAV